MSQLNAKQLLLEIKNLTKESDQDIAIKTGLTKLTIHNVKNKDFQCHQSTTDALKKYFDDLLANERRIEKLREENELLKAHNRYLETRLKIALKNEDTTSH